MLGSLDLYAPFFVLLGSLTSLLLVVVSILAPLGLLQFGFVNVLVRLAPIVPVKHLGGDFHLGILRHHVGRNLDSIHNLDARFHNGIVLHVRHRNEIVNLGDSQKVQGIRHHGLEPRILDTRHLFGTVEIRFGRVASFLAFAGIVHEVLGDFSERAAFFAVVNDDTASTALGGLDALFNGVRQVRTTRANVTSKDL
jgi:hypothetical protein